MSERERREHDGLGDIGVPVDAIWGAHTQRALDNFAVSATTTAARPDLLVALAEVKIAAAITNGRLGVLAADDVDLVVGAATEVVAGRHHDAFPIDLVQGGGGTATNMNMNEVVANLANLAAGAPLGSYSPVHPNDHVNRSQSTNDAYPTALQIAVVRVGRRALDGIGRLAASFRAAADRQGDLVRLGRTCLQDAVPLTVAETHLAHAHALERVAGCLSAALDELLAVPLGATAIGTGVGAPAGFAEAVVAELAHVTGLPLVPAVDRFDALANLDGHLGVAVAASRVALVMGKIAQDLRWWSSGPVGGIGEMHLPAVQVGSSIMPGKVNPVIPETVIQVSFDVRAAAYAVELAVGAGELELNVYEPVVARHLLGALAELGDVAVVFATRCVDGLAWDAERVGDHLRGSLGALVEMAGREGYEHAADAARDRNVTEHRS
jgi:aspartate ammonia-lyase